MQAVQVKGVDTQAESAVSSLPEFVSGDDWKSFSSGKKSIILGSGLARTLHVQKGDWITMMIADTSEGDRLLQPKRIRLQAGGLLLLSRVMDQSLALVPLADAQMYLSAGETVSGIALRIKDPFSAPAVVQDAANKFTTYVRYHNWMKTYGYMFRDIQMIRAIMYLAMILVIGVACSNIVSTLVMAVKEKSTDIAVLRTLGAGDRVIRTIFIMYGLLSGLSGSLLGVLSGVMVSLNLTRLISTLESISGHKLLSGKIYFIDFLPTELHWLDVIFVLLTAIMLTLLASWYPAQRACRLEPARILKGH